jgi:hypothetical protein
MSTNYSLSKPLASNGLVSLSESLNDYPKLTLVEYGSSIKTKPIGDILNYGGFVFVLESISIDKSPIVVNNIQDKITYSYVHVVKKLLEFPFLLKNFVDNNKGTSTRKNKDAYMYPIGSLVAYARGLKPAGYIDSPSFLVEISKTPGAEETATLKDFIDSKLEPRQLVYKFSGDRLSFVSLGKGNSIDAAIVKNYTIGYGAVSSFKNSPLSWNKQNNENQAQDLKSKKYKKLKNESYLIYEGNHNPHLPPPETANGIKYPRDLSIMFDNSGETKTCKITKYTYNQPAVEIEATFGYAHAAIELVADPNRPNVQSDTVIRLMSENVAQSGNAYQEVLGAIKSGKYGYPDDANFSNPIVWRLISVKEKEYIYENVKVSISPLLKNADGTLTPCTLISNSDIAANNTEVLIRELTQGWELRRFAQEDVQNWTEGSIQSWLGLTTLIALKSTLENSSILAKQQYYWMLYYAKINIEKYLYRKIPIWEQVDYGVETYSEYYKDVDNVDWQVEYISSSNIEELAGSGDSSSVAVIFPDANWSPELMLVARSRLKMSIGLSGNPDYDPYKRNYYGTNPVSITSGSEEFEYIKYSVLPSKNTKSKLGDLFNSYVSTAQVVSSISNQIDLPGTLYQDKPFTAIPDYGLKDTPIPKIKPGKVLASAPTSLDTRDDQYSSLQTSRTAQDHSFKNHLTTTTFTIADGRPPGATIRKPVYEEVQDDNRSNPYPNTVTLITSSNDSLYTDVKASCSIGGAESLGEALSGARFQLTMDTLSASSTSVTLHYLAGDLKPSLNGIIPIPGTNATWVVKGCTQTIQFADDIGFPQPIDLECGLLAYFNLSDKTVQLKDTDNNGKDSTSAQVTVAVKGKYGTPEEDIPEGFGRWLDTL